MSLPPDDVCKKLLLCRNLDVKHAYMYTVQSALAPHLRHQACPYVVLASVPQSLLLLLT